MYYQNFGFQFTHPGRGATGKSYSELQDLSVSIHAPREGCDLFLPPSAAIIPCFNSRTPGGVRHVSINDCRYLAVVSIHAPREGCDLHRLSLRHSTSVSIHAPREGCDFPCRSLCACAGCFNSRTPGGVRLGLLRMPSESDTFQFTHPGRGATIRAFRSGLLVARFNSRTPGGVRQCGAKLRIIGRINKRNLRLGVLS